MDRNAQGRRRPPAAPASSARPPVRIPREKKAAAAAATTATVAENAPPRAPPGRIREAKDSSEIIRVPKRVEAVAAAERAGLERRSVDDDPNARHFTVANVGKNGAVYLKPSRFQVPLAQTPATPPGTAEGEAEFPSQMGSRRPSAMSTSSWTPRVHVPGGPTFNHHPVPVPPLSMANVHDRRRTRSHSFSTNDRDRTPTFDTADFQVLLNGGEAGRPKSSVDLSDALLDMRIPHYRLGTPRFSERGTAYLHNSMYTATSDDQRSSGLSRGDYDKLFPAPPGARTRVSYSPYLHPSSAPWTPTRTPPAGTMTPIAEISPAIYDRVEARPHDAALVRYSSTSGRIIAATPARLIAQITSPLFLDYELLADFFLTFRNFLTSSALLEYMLARMDWALSNNSDAGRIVRVRTFVALRHWILNYFSDDFIPAPALRQRFCGLVNALTRALRRRTDTGGTDMNVLGELKKCWRRTCANYWPVVDALDTSPDTDILPGAVLIHPSYASSSASLPLSLRHRQSHLDFRRSSIIALPMPAPDQSREPQVQFTPETPIKRMRTASIPTSPLSEDSMTVLCCSVPFLNGILRDKRPKTPIPPENQPREKPSRPSNSHKRSGSFTDALRDSRPPLPSSQPDTVDLQSLQSLTFTGGLVRGLLLQPSPSKVDLLIPLSPPLEIPTRRSSGTADSYFGDSLYQGAGMRRFVGDVRRALSSRKVRHDSPASSEGSTNSSNSQLSAQGLAIEPATHSSDSWHQLDGPPRIDVLGEKIGNSYKDVVDLINDQSPGLEQADAGLGADGHELLYSPQEQEEEVSDPLASSQFRRLDSHVTTGSRSIVIVDDTGIPPMPRQMGALPSVSSWGSEIVPNPLFQNTLASFQEHQTTQSEARSGSQTAVASEPYRSTSGEVLMHDLLAIPQEWRTDDDGADIKIHYNAARKSSNVHGASFELEPSRHQLRRRPGGDLKAADHVHDLEPVSRHQHGDSYSTITRSIISNVPPNNLTGTHFSGQGLNDWQGPASFSRLNKDSMALLPTHSSQPNMRPSFERQVSHLKRLADDQQEGGIEDALAKLEGKPSSSPIAAAAAEAATPPPIRRGPPSSSILHGPVSGTGKHPQSTAMRSNLSPTTERQGASIYQMSESEDDTRPPARRGYDPESMAASSDGCAIESVDFLDLQEAPEVLAARSFGEAEEDPLGTSPQLRMNTPQGSFLLDDNESLTSDISTEIADHSGDEGGSSLGVRSFYFDEMPADEIMISAPHFRPPPTPPSTVGQAMNVSPRSERHAAPRAARMVQKPTLKGAVSAPRLTTQQQKLQSPQHPNALKRSQTTPSQPQPAHLPFVLAFESDVLAEQLTIIEKDALDEVEWKDLITLQWRQQPTIPRNWVDFLQQDANGIDIVIARFNLVVKWVVSEVLLTASPAERARCVTKFIHIAVHCHRLRNYASMYQITLALLSADLARLHRTWDLVAPTERHILARLQKLCQPSRNFHSLRVEMESVSAEQGCIPFIGLYTHDLMFNAQKPATVDPLPPATEKLVNFERYQTAAMIVKSLLRLIEASAKYVFRPHPEALSRCLWLASLEDAEIASRSRTLEAAKS